MINFYDKPSTPTRKIKLPFSVKKDFKSLCTDAATYIEKIIDKEFPNDIQKSPYLTEKEAKKFQVVKACHYKRLRQYMNEISEQVNKCSEMMGKDEKVEKLEPKKPVKKEENPEDKKLREECEALEQKVKQLQSQILSRKEAKLDHLT